MITFEDKVTNTAVETSLSAIPVTQKISAGDINQIKSVVNGIKTKTDNLTIPSAVNTDTLKSDILSAKTKTDQITISSPVNLNTINSYIRNGVETFTSNGTIATTTMLAIVNSASDITVTLPAASSLPIGTFINVKRLGTGNVIVAPNGSNNIDGANTSYNFNSDAAVRGSSRRFVVASSTDLYII